MQLCFKEHFMAKENKHDMLIKKKSEKKQYITMFTICLKI